MALKCRSSRDRLPGPV